MTDDEAVVALHGIYAEVKDRIRAGIDAVHAMFLAEGLVDDAASYRIVYVMLQHEIFVMHAILSGISEEDAGFGSREDFIAWVEREYESWNKDIQ